MRRPGWERRLEHRLEAARTRPYVLGEHDCFRVVCAAVEALTGVDRWPEFAGRYRTRREALALIASYGSNFLAAFDWFFGGRRIDVRWAQRGDICALATPDGERHLGVCLGERTAVLGAQGLIKMRTLDCICAWRVEG